jgi:hypothetical protein
MERNIPEIRELNAAEIDAISGGEGSLVKGALQGIYNAMATTPGQEYNALKLKVAMTPQHGGA